MESTGVGYLPQIAEWGDAAFAEVKQAFPGKRMARDVALCVWAYAVQPDITEDVIEEIAQQDPVIMEARRKKKISAHGKKRAKSLLGVEDKADDIDPNLSPVEREILLDLRASAALHDEFKKSEARLRKAEAAFEVARAKLAGMTEQSARNLAEFDAKFRPILEAQSLLAPLDGIETPAVTPQTGSAVERVAPEASPARSQTASGTWKIVLHETTPTSDAGETVIPDEADTAAADAAVNLLKKKTSLAPKTSMLEDDEVIDDGGEEFLDEEFHAGLDDCTKDTVVYWPDQTESLRD